MNYQPAPWFFDNGEIHDRQGIVATPAVALDTDEGMAVATLIAAAPELYDALKECVQSLNDAMMIIDLTGASRPNFKETLSRARAALDNATWYTDGDAAADNHAAQEYERRHLGRGA